jgi:RimJ/RimL family protein N-acetyltransferase
MQTERLLLREFQSSDLDREHEYAADPQVSQFAPWGPNTYEQTRQVLNDRLEEQRRWPRDEVTLAIERLEDRRLIGAIRLTIVSHADRSADFGYVLNRKYWNARLRHGSGTRRIGLRFCKPRAAPGLCHLRHAKCRVVAGSGETWHAA